MRSRGYILTVATNQRATFFFLNAATHPSPRPLPEICSSRRGGVWHSYCRAVVERPRSNHILKTAIHCCVSRAAQESCLFDFGPRVPARFGYRVGAQATAPFGVQQQHARARTPITHRGITALGRGWWHLAFAAFWAPGAMAEVLCAYLYQPKSPSRTGGASSVTRPLLATEAAARGAREAVERGRTS